MRSRPLTRLES
jgi:hypothetical protein